MTSNDLRIWRGFGDVFHQDFEFDAKTSEVAAQRICNQMRREDAAAIARLVPKLLRQTNSELAGDWNRGRFDILVDGAAARQFLELLADAMSRRADVKGH